VQIQAHFNETGVVVIGRNEGERLINCLQSFKSFSLPIVYVDSGSTDGSVIAAKALKAEVVNLDLSKPFTAARARNEGFARLMQIAPSIKFVQFVDGDCEVVRTWLEAALKTFDGNDELAVVCGRRKERYPNKTFYNFMCDLEWNTPVGYAKACGGDALMRVEAFNAVEGFKPTLIAGEEPELCLRLRAQGWKIERIDADMTLHDAAMTRYSQWWKRTVRAGHAFAEGAYIHGAGHEQHWVKETKRAWVWAFFMPLFILLAMRYNLYFGLLCLMVYPWQVLRLARSNFRYGELVAFKLAVFSVLGKFAELQGQFSFHFNRIFKHKTQLIEYK
jgi:GT2 family glycosyltransferase